MEILPDTIVEFDFEGIKLNFSLNGWKQLCQQAISDNLLAAKYKLAVATGAGYQSDYDEAVIKMKEAILILFLDKPESLNEMLAKGFRLDDRRGYDVEKTMIRVLDSLSKRHKGIEYELTPDKVFVIKHYDTKCSLWGFIEKKGPLKSTANIPITDVKYLRSGQSKETYRPILFVKTKENNVLIMNSVLFVGPLGKSTNQ